MYEYKGPVTIDAGEIASSLELEVEPGVYYVELKLFKNKPKSTLLSQVGPDEFNAFVDNFWAYYPKRNGKHLNKKLAQEHLNKLKPSDMRDVILGSVNFAKSKQAREGFAPDAHRWLARRGWEEWQEGEVKERNRATL